MVAAFPELVLGAALVYPCLHAWHCTGSLGYIISWDNFFCFSGSFVTDAEVLVTHIFSLVLQSLC